MLVFTFPYKTKKQIQYAKETVTYSYTKCHQIHKQATPTKDFFPLLTSVKLSRLSYTLKMKGIICLILKILLKLSRLYLVIRSIFLKVELITTVSWFHSVKVQKAKTQNKKWIIFIKLCLLMTCIKNWSEFFPTAFEKTIYKQSYVKCKTYFPPKSVSRSIMLKLLLIYR